MPGQAAEWPDYPFCSARCRKIDLGRWLDEKNTLPAEDQPKPEGDEKSDDRSPTGRFLRPIPIDEAERALRLSLFCARYIGRRII